MADDEILSSLPRTRPQRRSAKRDAPKRPAAKKPAPAKRPAAKAKPAPKAQAKAKPRAATASRLPPRGFAPPADRDRRPAPGGAELIGTAIQAAGELAQIGLAVGGQALRSALRRRD